MFGGRTLRSMAYEVFESLERDGRPLGVEEVAARTPGETRVLGQYESWRAALRVVARLEVEARRQTRGGFAVGIRFLPPARETVGPMGEGASEASRWTR
jgi:hypothetical protein